MDIHHKRFLYSTLLQLLAMLVVCLPGNSATISATAGPNAIAHPGTVSYSASAPQGGTSATSTVDFGHAFSHADATCGGTNSCDAIAEASFSDVITILDANGLLRANINLAGGRQGEGTGLGRLTFGNIFVRVENSFYTGPPCCQFDQPFTAGVGLAFDASTHASVFDAAPLDPNDGGSTSLGEVLFSFTVVNGSGQPISGFHYTSESLHNYGVSGGIFVAPEPSPIAFAIGGLLAAIFLKRRRQVLKGSPSA